jgi:C_GCAxxG_C_C family probable redox protein
MANYLILRERVAALSKRKWDEAAILARINRIAAEGIPKKIFDPKEVVRHKEEVLNRVQRRAEEYNFIAHNCPKGTALAVMEEFGMGNIEIIKALSPFPGFGGTGWICGGVTGGLIALGLHFGSNDMLDDGATGATISAARIFMPRFEQEVGSVLCPSIQEKVIFGRYMDPAASPENMANFAQAQGFAKCSLAPGIGARIAAEIIIDSLA